MNYFFFFPFCSLVKETPATGLGGDEVHGLPLLEEGGDVSRIGLSTLNKVEERGFIVLEYPQATI